MTDTTILQAYVHTLRHEADDVLGVELRPMPGSQPFPSYTAGAHIDLHLPNGMVRSYSLLTLPGSGPGYHIGVLKDRASRGGSRCVHEQLRIGTRLGITSPLNNFELDESASHSVLIAGGIGITPILCMARRLTSLGKPFELVYLARARPAAAFVDEITALGAPVHWHFDAEQGGPPDLAALLASRPGSGNSAQVHHYACGPAPMLDAFSAACTALGYANGHIERFTAAEVAAADDARSSYRVVLSYSNKTIQVTPGTTLLSALRAAGLDPATSCEEGICGTCETRVLEGRPDHRDSVLSAAERLANKSMMICVSGCKSESLVLEL